jgi:L-threonylcarbamoyladenylate synthase
MDNTQSPTLNSQFSILNSALAALRAGQTLLYPTDTLWGLGCDATLSAAVDRLYALKRRDPAKAMLVLASEAMLCPDLPAVATDLLLHSPRPTTVVMPAEWLALPVAHNLPAADGTVGVRVPRMDFCQKLLAALGHPIVSTSANLSGEPSPATYDDISEALRAQVDCCLPDSPDYPHAPAQASRIVRVLPSGDVTVLRP